MQHRARRRVAALVYRVVGVAVGQPQGRRRGEQPGFVAETVGVGLPQQPELVEQPVTAALGGGGEVAVDLIDLGARIAGAWLLLQTPESLFREAIPWLLLFATLLFIFGARINALFRKLGSMHQHASLAGRLLLMLILAGIAVYGGFFNAVTAATGVPSGADAWSTASTSSSTPPTTSPAPAT